MANTNETEGGKSPRAQAKRNVLDRLAQLRTEGKLPDSEAALDSMVDKIIDQEVKTVPGGQKQGAKKDITRIYLREKPHFVKDIEDYKARIGMSPKVSQPSESSAPIHPPSREHPLVAAFQTEMGEMYEVKNVGETTDADLYAFSIKQGDLSSEGQIDAILKKYIAQIAACPARERDAVEDMLTQERTQQIKKLDEYVAQHNSEDLEKTIIISPTSLVPTPEPGSSLKPVSDADVATRIFNHMRTERKTNLLDEEVIKYMTDYFEVHPELKEEFKDKNPNNPPGMDQKRFNRLFRRLHLNQVYYERKGSRDSSITPTPAHISIPDVIAPGDYKNEKTDSQIFTDAEQVQKDIEEERQRQKLPTSVFPVVSSEPAASLTNPDANSPDSNDTQLIPLADDTGPLPHPKLIFDESQIPESNDSGVANKSEGLNRGGAQEEGSEQKEGVVSNQQGATPMKQNNPNLGLTEAQLSNVRNFANSIADPIIEPIVTSTDSPVEKRDKIVHYQNNTGAFLSNILMAELDDKLSTEAKIEPEKMSVALNVLKTNLEQNCRNAYEVVKNQHAPEVSLPGTVAPSTSNKNGILGGIAVLASAAAITFGVLWYNGRDDANAGKTAQSQLSSLEQKLEAAQKNLDSMTSTSTSDYKKISDDLTSAKKSLTDMKTFVDTKVNELMADKDKLSTEVDLLRKEKTALEFDNKAMHDKYDAKPVEPIKPVEPVKPVDLSKRDEAIKAYLGAYIANDATTAKAIWNDNLKAIYANSTAIPSSFGTTYSLFEKHVIAAQTGVDKVTEYDSLISRVNTAVAAGSITATQANDITGIALRELNDPKEGN